MASQIAFFVFFDDGSSGDSAKSGAEGVLCEMWAKIVASDESKADGSTASVNNIFCFVCVFCGMKHIPFTRAHIHTHTRIR